MVKLTMLVGLPASGKSKFAEELAKYTNAIIHSSDKLREEMFGNVDDTEHNVQVFEELHKRIKADLLQGKNVIYDATNLSYKRRMAFLQSLNKVKCKKECFLVIAPFEECLKRNAERERKVPEDAMWKMYKSITIPYFYEGWDSINAFYNYDVSEYFKYSVYCSFCGENGILTFSQDNSHHTLTLGEHCIKCRDILLRNGNRNFELIRAGLLHDIGKVKTKVYTNAKGEPTSEAHYYNHQYVSAYDSLLYLCEAETKSSLFLTAIYIQWHMQPYFIKTEKQRQKFINLVGKDIYNNVMLLHYADELAH